MKPEIVQPTSKNLTDLSFTLKWLPIDTGLLQSYTLFYTSRMISQLPVAKRQIKNEINIPVHSTNYTVKDLMPFSLYCFSLQASYAQEGVVFSDDLSDAICDINTPPLGEFVINFTLYFPADWGLSDSENYVITIVETVIFTITNIVMVVGQRNINLSSIVSSHDSRLLFHQPNWQVYCKSSYRITIQMVRQSTNSPKLSR